ncbi:MAG: serine/threonine protein kinase [Coriobacteriia bacterium]|nr:serine/threonine protein kinase [Coriobacteriia bacterium]
MDQPLILDRYRPLAELGAGGHGTVTLAYDTKMARRVAIKRLTIPAADTARTRARAGLAEARTAALLNHPGIVTVHEWESEGDEAFTVMEFLDGLSVADLLDETGRPLDEHSAAAVISAVVTAVTFAHANGVLHLDLKPGNVIVTRDGRVKVADFGIAALTDATGRARGSSGTIGYMPPEQIRRQRLDERTDVWGLAALAYELLTDANPFDADTTEGSIFKIEIAEIPAPSEFEPKLSAAIDNVLLTALSPEPSERFASVAEFGAALLPLLGDPDMGTEDLAATVNDLLGEDETGDAYVPGAFAERLIALSGPARRATAALVSGWLVWVGLGPLGLDTVSMLGAAVLAALAGVLAPGLGLALGLVALLAGLAVRAGAGWAVAFALPAIAYWVWRGRHGRGDALTIAAAPLLGALRLAGAAPLIVGSVARPVPAAVAGALAGFVTTVASVLAGRPVSLPTLNTWFLLDPWSAVAPAWGGDPAALLGPALVVLGWAAAAAVTSASQLAGRRWLAVAGALLAVALMGAGYGGWYLTGYGPEPRALVLALTPGAIVGLIVVALRPLPLEEA